MTVEVSDGGMDSVPSHTNKGFKSEDGNNQTSKKSIRYSRRRKQKKNKSVSRDDSITGIVDENGDGVTGDETGKDNSDPQKVTNMANNNQNTPQQPINNGIPVRSESSETATASFTEETHSVVDTSPPTNTGNSYDVDQFRLVPTRVGRQSSMVFSVFDLATPSSSTTPETPTREIRRTEGALVDHEQTSFSAPSSTLPIGASSASHTVLCEPARTFIVRPQSEPLQGSDRNPISPIIPSTLNMGHTVDSTVVSTIIPPTLNMGHTVDSTVVSTGHLSEPGVTQPVSMAQILAARQLLNQKIQAPSQLQIRG